MNLIENGEKELKAMGIDKESKETGRKLVGEVESREDDIPT